MVVDDDAGRAERAARGRLFTAIAAGDRTQVEALLAEQPTLADAHNDAGVSAMLYSLYVNEPGIAALLADSCSGLSVFDAAALGRVEALRMTLAGDPAVANAVAPDGFGPLGLAAFFGQRDAAQVLLQSGANPSAPSQNAMRVTPLHSAVAAKHVDIAADLLRHGAEVNATQADDFTPLHEAAQNGQVAMIALLLREGANTQARLADGRTPCEVAEAHGMSEAVALLRAHDASS